MPWWDKPYRIIQTNLREIDADLDPRALIDGVLDMHGNVLIFNVGGIRAFYPTGLRFQERSPCLRGDLVGQVLETAHQAGIRVIGRFDFSKAGRQVYEEHPDWFQRDAEGRPVAYNGLYHACLNGGWYRQCAPEILREALGRYDLDGIFFNMLCFQEWDYSGRYLGPCRCGNCRRLFFEMYGLELPSPETRDGPAFRAYIEFRRNVSVEAAARFYEIAKETRPSAGVMQRFEDSDLLRLEVNRSLNRPLPEWWHWSGEQAKWAASFGRGKPYSSAIVHFLDYPYRFAAETASCQALRLAQQLANGARPDYYVLGTLDQEDKKPFARVREIFAYHQKREELYDGLESAAEIALYHSEKSADLRGGPDMAGPLRGCYRILAESHLPFDLLSDYRLGDVEMARILARYAAVILPNASCLGAREREVLDNYVEAGGNLIATFAAGLYDGDGSPLPGFGLRSLGAESVLARRDDMRSSYFRVTDAAPGAAGLIALDGPYLHVKVKEGCRLEMRLIPPQRFGPPELCYPELETGLPGIIHFKHGRGGTSYLPWQPDLLYHRHGIEEYRALIERLVRMHLPRPVLSLEAPRQVEVTIHRQPSRKRTIVHLVNHSGCQGTACHEPVTVHGARLSLRTDGGPGRVWAAMSGAELDPIGAGGGYVTVGLPPIRDFEAIVFEESGG
ncbi:MAG: hypothetical protein ACM3X6_03095 [Patescibacteria group bacterium]